MDIDDLAEAERFQRMFVKPLVNAVRAEVRPLAKKTHQIEQRLRRVESNQKRALLGLSAAAGLVSVGMGVALDWLKKHFGW